MSKSTKSKSKKITPNHNQTVIKLLLNMRVQMSSNFLSGNNFLDISL
jgi:hypothetical protein